MNDIKEVLENSEYDAVKPHIFLYPLMEGADNDLKSFCPGFEMCGINWIFAVDWSVVEDAYLELGYVTEELALKWLSGSEEEIVGKLYGEAYVNMLYRAPKHLSIRPYFDDENINEAVPVFQISLNDMKTLSAYTEALILFDPLLKSLHDVLGDFYLFPRFRSRFFVISKEDLVRHERTPQESIYRMLVRYKFTRIPPSAVLSNNILYCDSEKLKA